MPNTSPQNNDPVFWFCVRIGNWKWDINGIHRYRQVSNKSGKVRWMKWERVYLFGPPPEEETQP